MNMKTQQHQNTSGNTTAGKIRFGQAFTYPFRKFSRIFNILWLLVPIVGVLAVSGYGIWITQKFIRGEYRQLPKFHFGKNLKLGFFIFLKFIPLITAIMVIQTLLGYLGTIGTIITVVLMFFVYPILMINFLQHETIAASFDVRLVKLVFTHIGDYIITTLKAIALTLIFLAMCLILIGIPALHFTQYIFLADFYRRRVLNKG